MEQYPNDALSGQQFWCLQKALSRRGVSFCLHSPLWWCTSEMCSWDNQVNYLLHHHQPTWGDEKTLHHLWIRKCSKSTQMMKHAVQGVHVQLPIMHTSKVLLIVQCMKALTISQSHLSSSMVLLSVESAATRTSTGVCRSSTLANLCLPLKNWHRAARSKQRGSTIKFRDEQFYQ